MLVDLHNHSDRSYDAVNTLAHYERAHEAGRFVGLPVAAAGLFGAYSSEAQTRGPRYQVDMNWPKPLPGKWVRLLLIAAGILIGGVIGSLILLLPMWYYSLSIVGLGVRHIFAAGALGAALGAFFGGLLVYWTTRE